MNQEHKKLERLILFSEVAQHLSFTAAADKLEISRGHLSAQIRRLEKDMGLPLLIRSTRSVRLTAEGERVLAGMLKIRHYLLELERSAEHEGNAVEGLLKITAPLQFTERYLFDILNKFKDLYPLIEFSVDCSYTRYDLNKSDFDVAFRATNEPPQNMVAKALFSYKQCCCASPDYFRKFAKPLQPLDLMSHQCLKSRDLSTWSFTDIDVPVKGWFKINDNKMLKNLALMGVGIIQVPEYLVDQEIASGKLEAILEEYTVPSRSIYMIHPQLIHQSKKLTAFTQFTRSYFDETFAR